MSNRTFDWAISGFCLFAAVSFGLLLGNHAAFLVGVFMFFCGGFFERAQAR